LIACILLAAGAASRFGSQKLMVHLPDGRRLIQACASNLLAARVGRVVAVVRHDPELMAVLKNCGCEIVINERADEGMGTSIAAGVAETADASGWLIALGDMPSIRVDTVVAIADALRGGAKIAVPTIDGRRGHPVGFSTLYGARLQSLSGDTGAREIVKADASFVEEIRVDDEGIFLDIDTPADMKR
jgi:molybdenum cofactor cytidylyltransferase